MQTKFHISRVENPRPIIGRTEYTLNWPKADTSYNATTILWEMLRQSGVLAKYNLPPEPSISYTDRTSVRGGLIAYSENNALKRRAQRYATIVCLNGKYERFDFDDAEMGIDLHSLLAPVLFGVEDDHHQTFVLDFKTMQLEQIFSVDFDGYAHQEIDLPPLKSKLILCADFF